MLAGFLSLIGQKRAADITRVAYGKTTSEMWGFVRRLDQYKASFFAGVKAAGIDAILCPGLALPAWKHGGARELTPADTLAIDAIVEKTAPESFRLRTLIREVILSDPFRKIETSSSRPGN